MKVGVVLFDAANSVVANDRTLVSLDKGWASLSGEPAQRVQSIHDLPSDVIWLTNLGYSDFHRAKLSRHPNFRSAGWLRSTVPQLAAELGVDARATPPHVTAAVIATLAQRVVTAAEGYGVTPVSATLNLDVAKALAAPRPALPASLYGFFQPIAEHPLVQVVPTIDYAAAAAPTLTVRRNRLLHARDVLATPAPPDAGWELEKGMRAGGDDRWLEAVKTPFLAKCTVSHVNPAVADVLSWGSGSRSVRNWLTDIEWRVVREYGDITIDAALICREPARPLEAGARLPAGGYAALSFTQGLLAEQIWTAMTLKQTQRGDGRYTAAAAWLRSADRMIMFRYAQALHARGVDVMSYGVGNVVVRYAEGGLRRALDRSTDLGLLPPAAKFAEAALGEAAW